MKMNPEQMIWQARLRNQFLVTEGECISVATALAEFFGGEIYAVSSRPNERVISHAFVKIDGKYYDGRGQVELKTLRDEFAPSCKTLETCIFQVEYEEIAESHGGQTHKQVLQELENVRD